MCHQNVADVNGRVRPEFTPHFEMIGMDEELQRDFEVLHEDLTGGTCEVDEDLQATAAGRPMTIPLGGRPEKVSAQPQPALSAAAATARLADVQREIEQLHRLQAECTARLAALEGEFFLLKHRLSRVTAGWKSFGSDE
jgi:hypothetical protein